MIDRRQQFEQLISKHHSAVYRAAFRIVRSSADAEDLTQQVYLQAFKQTQNGQKASVCDAEAPGRVLCWLASRLACNHLRDARNRQHYEGQAAMSQERASPEAASAEFSDANRAVRRCLDALPEELRVPLVLRFQEGMTFDAVAEALELSESTAHARVQRALERLRKRLIGLGVSVVPGELPHELSRSAFESVVPTGLEATLLASFPHAAPALSAAVDLAAVVDEAAESRGSAASPVRASVPVSAAPPVATTQTAVTGWSSAWWLGLAGVAAVTAGAIWYFDSPVGSPAAAKTKLAAASESLGDADHREPEASVSSLRVAAEPSVDESAQVEPEPADSVDVPVKALPKPKGVIEGVVVDEAGTPLAGARVLARSRATVGKASRFRESLETSSDGRFRLEVPVESDDGQAYFLSIAREDYHPFRHPSELLVGAGEVMPFVRASLPRWAPDVEGDYGLTVTVTDAFGNALPDALVRVARRVPADGELGFRTLVEAFGNTDLSGRVELQGRYFGSKRLSVNLRPMGYAMGRAEFAVESSGAHSRVVELHSGLSIVGRVHMASAGGLLEPKLGIEAFDSDGEAVGYAVCDRAGRFELRGLDPGDVTLRSNGAQTSPFSVGGVAAGAANVELRLKRRDDPRPIGLHGPELHGRVVDAATGESVIVDSWTVETYWVAPEVTDWRTEVLPSLLHPVVAQRAMMSEPLPPSAEFHLSGLRPGRYLIFARVRGYALATAGPFQLDGEESFHSDIVLELHRGLTCSGTVLGESGEPVADATVFLTLAPAGALPEDRYRLAVDQLRDSDNRFQVQFGGSVRTGAEGRFALKDVLPNTVLRCVALHPEHGYSVSESVGSGTSSGEIELRF